MKTLAEHIKNAKITRAKFAGLIGISAPYLSQIIAQKRRPSLDVAVRIATETNGAVPVHVWVGADATKAGR